MAKTTNIRQIRIPPELDAKAMERAKQMGLTISAYIKYLIAKDVDRP